MVAVPERYNVIASHRQIARLQDGIAHRETIGIDTDIQPSFITETNAVATTEANGVTACSANHIAQTVLHMNRIA